MTYYGPLEEDTVYCVTQFHNPPLHQSDLFSAGSKKRKASHCMPISVIMEQWRRLDGKSRGIGHKIYRNQKLFWSIG
ncbi:hypothetical protein AVEN_51423-1, partial [Araneus ventricosus]